MKCSIQLRFNFNAFKQFLYLFFWNEKILKIGKTLKYFISTNNESQKELKVMLIQNKLVFHIS